MPSKRIAFLASEVPEAERALEDLLGRYSGHAVEDAEVIVSLGGDGFMLKTLHDHMGLDLPIYGMNLGSVGFLMNTYQADGLLERIGAAECQTLTPLRMVAVDHHGQEHEALAINEVSVFRETRQAAKISIRIDGRERLEELICDGAMVATPAGSTAYNLSAHGPILPLEAGVLALTPISAFRPRGWRGALLPHTAKVRFEILDADKRPVSAVADNAEVRDVIRVDVAEDLAVRFQVLFDPEHNLEERILREQFIH